MAHDRLTRFVRTGEGMDALARRIVARLQARAFAEHEVQWATMAEELEQALRELHLEHALIDIDWPTRSLSEYAMLLVGDVLAARDAGGVDLLDARRRVMDRLQQMRSDLRIRRTR